MDPFLSQEEAERLLGLEKFLSHPDRLYSLPRVGGVQFQMDFHSADHREKFDLRLQRGRLNLMVRNHQLLGRRTIGLARLDISDKAHMNPDGVQVGPNHIHLYKEGYALKFAHEIPPDVFTNLDDPKATVIDFLRFCSVVDTPEFSLEINL